MKQILTLVATLAVAFGATAQEVPFEEFFFDRTMRFDYYHSGNSQTEQIFFDELKEEPYWGGSKRSLIDTTDLGNHLFRIVDAATERVIYSRGFCSLFNEWQKTPEAYRINRSYPESVIFPYPKKACRIEFFSRDAKGRFAEVYKQDIAPDSYWVERFAPRYEAFDVAYHGAHANRVDIVLLPEGYSEGERAKFEEACRCFAESMFSFAPYDKLKPLINIRAVWAPSRESGVTIPGEGVWRETACDANFYTFDSERYQTVSDQQRLRDLAAHVPYDYIYVLSNTQKYGGGGIFNFYGISAAHNPGFTGKVYIHEFGHLLLGLGDEYVGNTAYDETMYDTKIEPWEPNVTSLVDFDKKQIWKSLLAEDTPVPTPTTEAYRDKVGVYEGAGYIPKGLYRPMQNCLMNSFRGVEDFCPVCQKAIEEYILWLCR